MNINYISNPIYIDWLKDNNGNKISMPVVGEQKKVADNKIVLDYIPDPFYKVIFQSGSTPTVEISMSESIVSSNQYKVDYSVGYVYLHSSLETTTLTFNYYKRGIVMYPASRIYTRLSEDGKTIESTLQQQIDELTTYSYKGVYDEFFEYTMNDMVYYNGSTYICKSDTSIGVYPTNEYVWRIMAAGYHEAGIYNNSLQYYVNDVVWYDSTKSKYVCIDTPTIGTNPTNSAYWDKFLDLKSIYDDEGLRVTAENNRVNAEGLRVTAENNRVSAEGSRVTAEGLRVTAENNRVNAEGLRVTAEGLRVTAENNRVNAEGLRVTAENGRVSAEGSRDSAEIIRQNSYSEFINKGNYDNNTSYKVKNMVMYNGSSYICKLNSIGNLPTDTIYWDLLAQRGSNLVYRGLYDNGASYSQYDAVTYNGVAYICKLASIGNVPTNSTYWDIFVDIAGDSYVEKTGGTMSGNLTLPKLNVKSETSNNMYSFDYNETYEGLDFLDIYGNQVVVLSSTPNAVNEITIKNSANGDSPTISATGGNSNINLNLITKGNGVLNINGNKVIDSSNFYVGTQAPSTPTTNMIWIDTN